MMDRGGAVSRRRAQPVQGGDDHLLVGARRIGDDGAGSSGLRPAAISASAISPANLRAM